MKFIEQIEKIIDCNKTIDEQSESLAQFDNITESEIIELSKCVKSTHAGILIEYLGYEKLENHLPLFLEFLQDLNWPATQGAIKMLLGAEKALIPEIKRVFKDVADDQIWHYWILLGLIQHWNLDLVEKIKPELLELVNRGDKEGASIIALRILKDKQLISEKETSELYHYLLKKFESDKVWIDELNDEMGFTI